MSESNSNDGYVGAIDQGTTSTRFIVFNKQGEEICSAQKEHTQYMPKEGYVEHDAAEIWDNTVSVIESALNKGRLSANDILAIGITNQRETTVIWDRHTGQPLYRALVWMDMRTQQLCEQKKKEFGAPKVELIRRKTGLPIVPYFSVTKLRWLIDNVDEVRIAVEEGRACVGTVDSWLLFKLSGERKEHLTDVTNASRTLLFNLETLEWDEELLSLWNIDKKILPRIVCSSEVLFPIQGVKVLEGVPVGGVLGDQQAALFGQVCFKAGEAKNTYGTGCFLLLNTGENLVHSKHGLLSTVAFKRKNDKKASYALEGSVAIGGAVIQWLRDNLGVLSSAGESEQVARQVEDNGGVYFVPAFSGLFAPYWEPRARGVIVGLTRYASRAHIVRAALEATAFQVQDVFNAMLADAGGFASAEELKVDGGMVKNSLLLQFQSDLLGLPLVVPQVTETTSLGAAFAAGLAVGLYRDLDDLKENWTQGARYTPSMSLENRLKLRQGWEKAINRSLDWSPAMSE